MKDKKVNFFTKLFDYKMWIYDFVKWTGAIPVIIDLRIKRIYCKDNKKCKKPKRILSGKYIVISNHISYIDPIILSNAFWERRLSFIATKEIFEYKFLGKFLKVCGEIEIDKENPSMSAFKTVEERLRRGHIVGVFPEGSIETKDQISGFKSGAILMAIMCDAQILPVYIKKREKRFKRQKVYFGEKIDIKQYSKNAIPTINDIQNIAEVLRQKEIELENIAKS